MARVMELFVIVNALAGIATFLGVRFVWRRSKDTAKRGFDIINADKEEDEWTSNRGLPPSPGEQVSSLPQEPSSLQRSSFPS